MNILFLTNHLNIGGITSYCLSLSTGLQKNGHNLYIASSGGEMLDGFINSKIGYIQIPIKTKQDLGPKVLLSALKLKKFINENHIDIVHSNSRTTQVLGSILNGLFGVRHITTCHGFFKNRLSRRILPCWGELTIAISEQVREHLIKDFKVSDKNIIVIHNGIDLAKYGVRSTEYGVDQKKQLGLREGPVVGIIARLSDVKGHIYLIKAMKIIIGKMPSAQLLIVGDGKMHSELADLSSRLGINDNLKFFPSLKDTRTALAAMDIFAMPSLKEGLGLSIMEAMAARLPVVASCVGGIRSLIKNQETGVLVKAADIEGLSQALLELLNNPQRASKLGNNARQFIEKNFSQEKMIMLTEEAYLRCLN